MRTQASHPRRCRQKRSLLAIGGLLLVVVALWLYASFHELRTGERLLPWSAYAFCGSRMPDTLPATVRVGVYEEFPNPWRLAKLRQVDFPVDLAVAARSRAEFLALRKNIQREYPQVKTVYFWPLLSREEGYYPGTWSDAAAVRRAAEAVEGLPVLWDLELPLRLMRGETSMTELSVRGWWRNRMFLDAWLRQRAESTHIWRSNTSMGLDPLFLRLIGMHFDPLDYPPVSLHLDLYMRGDGLPRDEVLRILRCGVARYGERFIPSFGVLNDGEGSDEVFVSAATLRRNLELARAAGVTEVWLFGVNGLNDTTLPIIRETLPLETLPGDS